MTTTRSAFTRQLLLCLFAQSLAFAAIGYTALRSPGDEFAESFGLPASSIWALAAILALAATGFSFRRLHRLFAEPLLDLSERCSQERFIGRPKKGRTREETAVRDCLLHLQGQADQQAVQIERLENEAFATRKEHNRCIEKLEEMEDLVSGYARIRQELSIDNATLRNEKDTLTKALDEERQRKVGREVERRAAEIYDQVETAIASAAVRSIWMPGLLSELRMPCAIISDLSGRLLDQWEHTSISQLRHIASEIAEQNRQQLDRLDSLLRNEPDMRRQTREDKGASQVTNDLRKILSEDLSKDLTLEVSADDGLIDSLQSESVIAFLRSFAHFARNQLEDGRLCLRLRENDTTEPLVELSVTSAKDLQRLISPDAISELAQSYGVAATDLGASEKEFHLSFPLEQAASR